MKGETVERERLADEISEFISFSFLPDEPAELDPDLDLIESGILDSLAVVEVADFLEELIGAPVRSGDLTPENIASVKAMARFVESRRRSAA